MGGHKPKAISGENAVWLSQRLRDGDFTIRGLVAELAGGGLKVDVGLRACRKGFPRVSERMV
jgi:transposase